MGALLCLPVLCYCLEQDRQKKKREQANPKGKPPPDPHVSQVAHDGEQVPYGSSYQIK